MTGHPPLIAHIEALIRERGRIPFSRFMDAVLYHPEYGYYARADNPIGRGGDFYTAADLDPAMGRMLAKLFSWMAERIPGFRLVELGAGAGRMARHILEARTFPYVIVERSARMRERQREALAGLDVEWRDTLSGEIRGCVFSNEFFDALPVRRFRRRASTLRELFVTEGFEETEGDPEVAIDLPLLADGATADISLDARAWIERIGRAIETGYHLAIDYGYREREFFARRAGTLMCYRNHRADGNPFSDIGLKDLTAHVNFTDLLAGGARTGLEETGLRTQREFLIDLGLLDVMEALALSADARSIQRLQALKNLLLPPMMGDRFRVLLQRKNLPPETPPGFGPGPAPA